jgi:glycolate oxidase iron-sulfur subunit
MTARDRATGGLTAQGQTLLDGEYGNMLSCVRCGLCLTSCPTYVLSGNEAEGPRGRVALARLLTEGAAPLTPDLVAHEQNCLVCDACTAVCPAGVRMDPLQVALRTAIEPQLQERRPLRARFVRRVVFRGIFADMRTFRLAVGALRLYQRSGLQRAIRGSGLLHLLKLDRAEALLPPIQGRFLRPRGKRYPAEGGAGRPSGADTAPVSLFAGCVMSTALAEIDRATIRVLQRAGHDVIATTGQGCCGALHAHGGDLAGMKRLAKRNIVAFERDGDGVIVNNAAGCGAMLKDYAHHFADDPEWAARARSFSARVRDITEWIKPGDLPMRRTLALPVTYQDPCHLVHAQRISKEPRALLRAIPGLELREMAESGLCCGSAGVYNVTNPVQSQQLQERKLANAAATGAETIVTANPGCLMQLRGGLAERGGTTRVKHIVELLDEASAP